MKLFTIGFTKKSAETFFTLLGNAGVKRIIDVRLNNSSQLAGFAKRDDLRYFARAIHGIDYLYMPELAPTKEILEGYKKRGEAWDYYVQQFQALMFAREVEGLVSTNLLDHACLLCSEHKPDHCHRRLVAEYLRRKFDSIEIEHLG